MSSYASPTDFLARKDARTVGDLVGDSGSRVSAAALLTDTNLQAVLDDASGVVDSEILVGGRYATTDLAALTGNSLALLKRLTCDIAMALLWERRPYLNQEAADRAMELSLKALARLRSGENIFNVTAVIEAGLPEITGASLVRRDQLNLISGRARGHFYVREQLPDNR